MALPGDKPLNAQWHASGPHCPFVFGSFGAHLGVTPMEDVCP